jgi:hypothetical protein
MTYLIKATAATEAAVSSVIVRTNIGKALLSERSGLVAENDIAGT